MPSIGVQAEISDQEGVLGLFQSFHSQLLELVQTNVSLLELNAGRGQVVQQSETVIGDLEGKMRGLVDCTSDMESMLRENQHVLQDQDTELEELANRMEHLDMEIRNLENEAKSSVGEDIDNEQRLTGFAVEELYRKMDTLAHLHHRLERATQDKQEEWDQYKSDCSQDQEELRPYLDMHDHLDELTLARYAGMQSMKETGAEERDLAERLSMHHLNKVLDRQLQQQLQESQIQQQDLEDEIGALVAQKRDLWKKCLDLENCLDDLKDSTDETHPLRPSSAYADLPFVLAGRLPMESDGDEDGDEGELEMGDGGHDLVSHGKMLHRCPKGTNIAIGPDISADAEDATVENVTVVEESREEQLETETKHDSTVEGPTSSIEQPDDIQPAPDQDGQDEGNADNTRAMSRAQAHRISGGEEHTTMVMKLRQRIGIGRHSSSTKVKNPKVSATGSFRALTKDVFSKRRRN